MVSRLLVPVSVWILVPLKALPPITVTVLSQVDKSNALRSGVAAITVALSSTFLTRSLPSA